MAELIILGSGTGIPSLRRASPALFLFSGESKVLIDSGPGTLRRMLEIGVACQDVDLLLYTHIHPDHVADLVPFLFACKYADHPRKKDLLCVGGQGFERYVERLKELYGRWIDSDFYRLTVIDIDQKRLPFRDMTIFSKPMAHLPESAGYRIELNDGKSIALSGDTDYTQTIVDLAQTVDLLVLECSFPEGRKIEGHLTPSLAGRIASESRCKRLLLTHLYPVCDEVDIVSQCRETFEGEIILGEDLMRIRI